MLWKITALVFLAGCVGGSVTGLVAFASSGDDSESVNRKGDRSKSDNAKKRETGRQQLRRLSFTYKNPGCETVFAGLAGHVFLGGIAAIVYWGLYGPFSGFAVLGAPYGGSLMEPFLTVGQLAGSIVLGIGGPAFLEAESQRRCKDRFKKRRLTADAQQECGNQETSQPPAEVREPEF